MRGARKVLAALAICWIAGLPLSAAADPLSVPFSNLQGPPPPVEISTGTLRDVLADPSPNVEFEQTLKPGRPAARGLGALFPIARGIQFETALGGRLAAPAANAQEAPGKLPGAELTGFGLAIKLAAGRQWQISIGYRRDQSLYPDDGSPQLQPVGVPQDSLFFGIWHSF